ncbi:MAG TPA: glutamate--tRNA ligase [Anaerolineae bacterium]|nr:glutamate--tRNA ligase [Anaerolineae bacterium]
MTNPVRVRFAPSPTGYLHVGGLRTALFNWLFARKHGGVFILRIEDTDQKRYTPGGVRAIMDGLLWLGLQWDEGPDRASLRRMQTNEDYEGAPDVGGPHNPYIQSLRLPRYKEAAEELIARGAAYRCDCSPQRLEQVRKEQMARKEPPRYDRLCQNKKPGAVDPNRPHVVRLAVPLDGQTILHDAIRGQIVVENRIQDDFVLLKSDGFPTYHLAAMVDDHDMHISHVLRGDEWLPSLPKHFLIYQAFGWTPPVFAHLPVILNPTGKGKMSKRKAQPVGGKFEESVFVSEFREAGYLPEALRNFLALVGWAPGEGIEQEIFTIEELTSLFSLEHVNPAPAAFPYDKLDWMNGAYIRALPSGELAQRLYPFLLEAGVEVDVDALHKITPGIQERLVTLKDAVEMTDFLFGDGLSPDPAQLAGKGMAKETTLNVLKRAETILSAIEPFEAEPLEHAFREAAEAAGMKPGLFFTPIRVAVTGKTVSPPLFASIAALGREKTVERLKKAEQLLLDADPRSGAEGTPVPAPRPAGLDG